MTDEQKITKIAISDDAPDYCRFLMKGVNSRIITTECDYQDVTVFTTTIYSYAHEAACEAASLRLPYDEINK